MIIDASITRALLFLLDLFVEHLCVSLKPRILVQFNLLLVLIFWTIVIIGIKPLSYALTVPGLYVLNTGVCK